MTSPRVALGWSLAERYVSALLALAASMIMARLLTPAEIGKFSLCAAALAIAATMRDFGISEYIIQERELTEQKLRGAYAMSIVTAWSAGLVAFLLREPIAHYYGEAELGAILAILCLNFVLLPFATPAFAVLNRDLEFRKVFFIQITATALQAVAGVTLAVLGHGARSLAWASVIGIGVQILAITMVRPKNSFMWPSFTAAAGVFRYGIVSVTSRVIDTATGNAHEFIIGKQLGFAELGLFSRAMGLVEMFSNNVTAAVARVAMPAMANAHRDRRNISGAFARSTAIFTSVAWPFFGFVAVTAPEIIRVLFGPQWDAAAPVATLLAISMFPPALFALSASALAAMGQVQRRLKISLQFAPIHLAGLFIASLLGGLQVMALAWMVTRTLLLWLHSRQLRVAMGAGFGDIYAQSLPNLPLAMLTASLQWGTVAVCRIACLPALVTLGLVLALGLASWYAAVRLASLPVHDELVRIHARLRGSRA